MYRDHTWVCIKKRGCEHASLASQICIFGGKFPGHLNPSLRLYWVIDFIQCYNHHTLTALQQLLSACRLRLYCLLVDKAFRSSVIGIDNP